ncbi:hypothetical protein [Streptomyces sp. NBC_01455]|uniref:hypothetical protein n=1 Tax=Streptomyces sp. NBC_01455 TaxID=2903874 RepID=UPI002E32B868|nr:hypothetical protein [Streptomyces sp. NBC_01455]
MWQARTAARAERNRLAVRLRDAVLHRTSALVELAHRGRLDEVSAEARTALAAVRELLHGLEHGPESERRLAPHRRAPTSSRCAVRRVPRAAR